MERENIVEGKEKKPCLHSGHRQRLIDKIEKGNVCQHEYLEALLFSALPRKNTNDIAHRLLAEFGSIQNVLYAPIPALERVEGVGRNVAAFLHVVGVCLKGIERKADAFPDKFEVKTFLPFLKKRYENITTETLEFFIVDDKGRICSSQNFISKKSGSICVESYLISEYFSMHKGSGVIMVHNHPFGESKPSHYDDVTTANCKELAIVHNLAFIDHYICAPDGIYSYSRKSVALSSRKGRTLPFEEGV